MGIDCYRFFLLVLSAKLAAQGFWRADRAGIVQVQFRFGQGDSAGDDDADMYIAKGGKLTVEYMRRALLEGHRQPGRKKLTSEAI